MHLVLAGGGGTLCGLSNIDYFDASENPTPTFYCSRSRRGTRASARRPNRITAWLDGEQLVDIDTTGRRLTSGPKWTVPAAGHCDLGHDGRGSQPLPAKLSDPIF